MNNTKTKIKTVWIVIKNDQEISRHKTRKAAEAVANWIEGRVHKQIKEWQE